MIASEMGDVSDFNGFADSAAWSEGLIDLKRGCLHVPDIAKLMAVTGFEPNYLHLDRRCLAPEPDRT